MYSTIAGTRLVNNLSTAIILFINQYQNHDIDKLTWKDRTVLKDMFCRNNKMHNNEHFIMYTTVNIVALWRQLFGGDFNIE